MKTLGIFEAKTKLSQICEEVAETRESVTVTKRGKPLVRIDPIESERMTIRERRAVYDAENRREPTDGEDFTPPPRSDEVSAFRMEE